MNLFNKVLIITIILYRKTLSPSSGFLRFLPFYPKPSCIFHPTCSEYAILSLKKDKFFISIKKILKRIGRCNPWNEPKVDYP